MVDYRTLCVQQVEALQTALANAAATGKVSSYSLEGQTFTYRSLDEVRNALMFWQRELARLQSGMVALTDMRTRDAL